MNKQEFLTEIGRRLEGFPPEEIERSKEYFLEMIEDRMEDGMSEEEAVADIGTVDEAVADILKDIPLTKVIKAKMKPEGKLRAWEIICLILGSPIWVPLLITAIVLIFVWYIVIWVIVISFFVVDLALFASGLAAIVIGVISLAQLEPAAPVLVIGTGLCLIGISILLFIPLLKLAKVTGKLGKKTALWIKSWFVRRKKNA